ncbi:polysaccharide deacetylase family protein [Akkermansiaceae bacterium]|nr:polysaccharide deacetylase family protein [Akkermansiaceae bacterium]
MMDKSQDRVYLTFRVTMGECGSESASFLFLTESEFAESALYVLEVLFDVPTVAELLKDENLVGENFVFAYTFAPPVGGANVWLRAEPDFWKNLESEDCLPKRPLPLFCGAPLLFGKPRVKESEARVEIEADVVASTYFLVTRYEEIVRPHVRDQHGRFPGRESLPFREGFICRPVVDEYAGLLRGILRNAGLTIPSSRRQFSVLLTHDVDSLRYYRRRFGLVWSLAKALLGRAPWKNVLESIAVGFGIRRDPFDNLAETHELDQVAGNVRSESVYFFIADRNDNRYLGRPGIESLKMKAALSFLQQEGAEIGLHASYEAGKNPAIVRAERDLLSLVSSRKISRNRHHYLQWREPGDGWAIAEAGIRWDSTMGYADVPGFRLGVCRPIQLFDPVRMERLGIEEHPLIVMDNTLSDPKYMGLDENQAYDLTLELLEQVQRHSGEFVALWHNHSLSSSDPKNTYHPTLYRRLVEHFATLDPQSGGRATS